MAEKLPAAEYLQIRLPATPDHTNAGGDIFGGWIMSQVDIGGSVPAVQCSKGRVVTVAVNRFIFIKPVFVGDMVNVFAWIKKVGNTSMTVDVEVYVERNPKAVTTLKVAEAQLVYVAVDDEGNPRPVE